MDEMKNALKEIDLQVVYKRLEERKKNITNDGKMSKRQLAAAYRGWYGVEARYHAIMHMSDEHMIKAESRNKKLSQKHDQDMKQMLDREKYVKGESTKAIKALRDDFTSMLAYQYAYKTNNLKNIEKLKDKPMSAQRKRPHSDKYDMFERERRSASGKGPRPLGSLRELENYRDELKIKFPSIDNNTDGKENTEKSHVNMLGEKQYDPRAASRNSERVTAAAFPKIEHAMGVEIKYRDKINDDKESFFSAPGGINCDTDSELRLESRTSITQFDMGQNLIMMRKKEQEKFERRRMLPATPNLGNKTQTKTERDCKRRKLPPVPHRCEKLYPTGAKNANDMHKFIRREATEVLESWSKDPKRLEIYEKAMALEKPDALLNRPQTTSEMFRELNLFKKQEKQFKEQQVDEQAIIVRQMTPKPRPLSPISTRMTEYSSRISSPLPQRERSPSFRSKREGSEKIPSVSRTSSYKELPDGPIELHENALLTAAERIEKERIEKERRNLETKLKLAYKTSTGSEKVGKNMENSTKSRRELPEVKERRVLPQSLMSSEASALNENTHLKIGRSTILRPISDNETIDTVSKVNAMKHETLREYERKLAGKVPLQPISSPDQTNKLYWKMSESLSPIRKYFNSERDAYTPLSRKSEPIRRKLTPIPDNAVSDQFNHVSSFTGNPALTKLAFSYDNFSRVPPDAKKRLELRAKNKRKVQLQNAKLEEEKEKTTAVNNERPQTRVSFNEKVVVFQTI